MASKRIVKDQIEINASRDKVWEVLTRPDYIQVWDDLPENYSGGPLQLDSVVDWEGYSTMTVTEFDRPTYLKLNWLPVNVEGTPADFDTAYRYTLSEKSGKTILRFEVGDFSSLPKGEDYYRATLEWLQTAKVKIKELSEE
jgi:uncharacterized protein YndB with AHSA1/START domain